MMRVHLLFAVLLVVTVTSVESVPNVQDINTLASKLMRNYRTTTLPSSDFTKQFVVFIKAFPVALGDLDELEEELTTVFALEMSWNDTSIQWNPEDHSNITNITLGLNEVWKPTLMLLNPNQRDLKGHSDVPATGLSYSHLGETKLISRVTLHTSCDLDMTYFPFDAHECLINLYLSGNDAYNILVYPGIESSFFKGNGVWTLLGWHMTGSFDSNLSFCFTFKRKPMFIMQNILLPLIILALLTPLVFVMPKSDGDRLSYSVTMLLSISVYMTIISDHLPKNSDPMPLISILIFVWYILNAIIVLIVILNIKVSHFEDSSIPVWVCTFVRLTRKISYKRCRKLICKRCPCNSAPVENIQNPEQNDEDEENTGLQLADNNVMEESTSCMSYKRCRKLICKRCPCNSAPVEYVQNPEQNDEDEENIGLQQADNDVMEESTAITWTEVSVALDRWCFVVIYIIKFVIPAVFIAVISSNRNSSKNCL